MTPKTKSALRASLTTNDKILAERVCEILNEKEGT